jgi:cardiolipin synthase
MARTDPLVPDIAFPPSMVNASLQRARIRAAGALDWRFMEWHEHLGLWLTGLWLAYALGLATWVIMQKREPAATLAWVFSLLFLPYLGFVIFYLFGPRKLRRSETRRRGSYEAIRAAFATNEAHASAESPHDLSVQLTRLVQTSTGMPLSTCDRIQLLVNGSPKYDALVNDIDAATDHVHLEYYIYDGDRSGTRIRDAMIAAIGRGVKVRLLMDGAGSFGTKEEFLQPLRDAGAELAVFHPLLRGVPHLRPLLNFRSHRKIAVIDGRIGYTGGINVTDTENDRINPDSYFRDLHTRLEGQAVAWMQRIFLEDWHYASGKTPTGTGLFPPLKPGRCAVQMIPSGPDNGAEPIHRACLAAIHVADERVWLSTPYFVPTAPALYALTSAAMRGMDTRVMIPARSDSRLVNLAARSYYDALLRAGVRVFEYQPRMLHTKALLIDKSFAILGSANFDNRSFVTNFEMSIAVHEAHIAHELERVWNEDQAQSVEIQANRPRAPFARRFGEALARLGSPLL